VFRGWDRSLCEEKCVFDNFPPIVRAVVDLVGSCLHVQAGDSGVLFVDLNDLRYDRMLKAHGVQPRLELEELVLHTLAVFREVIGKEGIMFTKEMLDVS
jgi:hypothetical protein